MCYPAYIGTHNTKLEIYIFQKITIKSIRECIYTYADLRQTQVSKIMLESKNIPITNIIMEDPQIFVGALLNYLDKTVIVYKQ